MIRGLTRRRKKDQRLYKRPAKIEAELTLALTQSQATLRERLFITDRESPEYLHTETLIYLIRDAMRSQNDHFRDAVLPVLLGRAEAILGVKVRSRLPNAAEIRFQALSDFSELLAEDACDPSLNVLDIYECRFAYAFRTLRVNAIRSELRQINRAKEVPEDEDLIAIVSKAEYDTQLAPLAALFSAPLTPANETFKEQLMEAINKLPPDQCDAVLLVYFMGFEEESDDPEKVTAATKCKCEGRTIRNRLKRAAVALSKANIL